MNIWDSSQPHAAQRPLFYIGSFPIDLTRLIALTHIAGMLVTTVLLASNSGSVIQFFSYSPSDLSSLEFISIFTYPFVHNIAAAGLFFALMIFMFLWFGSDVESYIGRKLYACLYVLLIFIPPLIATPFVPAPQNPLGAEWTLTGASHIHMGIFVAFAVLYPNAIIFFGLSTKLIAGIFLAIFTLIDIATVDVPGLVLLWTSVLMTYGMLKYIGIRGGLGLTEAYENWREESQEKQRVAKQRRKKQKQKAALASIDSILDKISSQGIESLTPEEKQQLENHRASLLKKDRKE